MDFEGHPHPPKNYKSPPKSCVLVPGLSIHYEIVQYEYYLDITHPHPQLLFLTYYFVGKNAYLDAAFRLFWCVWLEI